MHRFFPLRSLPLAAALLPVIALAQAQAPAAPAAWRSAFEGYQPFADAPIASWRESNDTVGRIGGWRAYAREAQGDEPAQAAPGGGSAQPAAAPSGGGTRPAPARPAAGHQH